MPIPNREPTLTDSLSTLKELKVEINTVLDVGILRSTEPLMKTFPDTPHELFEPVDDFYERIHGEYKKLTYNLNQVALGKDDGDSWLICISSDGKDRITHSSLSDKPVTIEEQPLLMECKKISKLKLDTWIKGREITAPYLLKIDIDGKELEVIEGAKETLKDVNIVVVEATLHTMYDRIGALLNSGFILYDIVDLAYYAGTLWQVDLVFINKERVEENRALTPMLSKKILDRSVWYPLSVKHFEARS